MNRILLAAALGAALLIPAGTALAAPGSGSYSGTTAQRGPVSFTGSAKQVRAFKIGVVWDCTDGDAFREMVSLPTFAVRRGTAAISFRSPGGETTGELKMAINARAAVGTFSTQRRYNEDDKPDAHGSILCKTGEIRFVARKR